MPRIPFKPKLGSNHVPKGHFLKCYLANHKIQKIVHFCPTFSSCKVMGKRAEVCNFLDFMDSPSNTYEKWPLH